VKERDSLGGRMKQSYEFRTRYYLPRRTYTILRLDGQSFHGYTRGLERPYDRALMEDMDATAQYLCAHVMGTEFAFVQSDEISLLLTDFETEQSQSWYDGNIQKIVSISAAMATAEFNRLRLARAIESLAESDPHVLPTSVSATFDARVFTIPDPTEVYNYFVWRQQDATKNSVAMTAQTYFPHEALQSKSAAQLQEMLFLTHGINWSKLPEGFKRGRFVSPAMVTVDRRTAAGANASATTAERRVWEVTEPPVFTQDRDYLLSRIPIHP
jgi:tRNA(His) guanylyltransferase